MNTAQDEISMGGKRKFIKLFVAGELLLFKC